MTSSTTSTKWLSQTVTVAPGAWYSASARLGALSSEDEVWLRLAWYASADGGGAQLDIVDTPSAAPGGGAVAVGATRAPANARSVRVRLMLRPADGSPTLLLADDVALEKVPAPPPTATPSPSFTPAPSATLAPPLAAVRTATASSTPAAGRLDAGTPEVGRGGGGPVAGGAASTTIAAGPPPLPDGVVAGAILRISELMPDPIQEGPDADYEWVEIANFGAVPANLEGFALRDNTAVLVLSEVSLAPGGVLVVAASRADTGSAELVQRLSGAIANGLGNGGDRLALITPEGEVGDAVSWGSDRFYAAGLLEVPAPGPGRSLLRRFTDDGSLVTVERSDAPTPGRADDSLVRTDETGAPVRLAVARGGIDHWAWVVLLAVAAAIVGWSAFLRARTARSANMA